MRKRTFHIFARQNPNNTDERLEIKAQVKPGLKRVRLLLTEPHVRAAMLLEGYADAQNCAGAVCVKSNKDLFGHDVTGIVDWWTNRVYVLEPLNRKSGRQVCRVYAHYDDTAGLFDADLTKLLKRIQQEGNIEINLYPVKRGRHPKTGKATRPAGGSGRGGHHRNRRPRIIGDELRALNFMRASAAVRAAEVIANEQS